MIFFENQPELAPLGVFFHLCRDLGHLAARENGIRYKGDTFRKGVRIVENQPEHLDAEIWVIRENGIRYKGDTFSIWSRAGDLPAGVVRFKYN